MGHLKIKYVFRILPCPPNILPRHVAHYFVQFPIHLGQFLFGQSIYAVNRQSVGCYFSACKDGFFTTYGGAVCTACLQIVVYCVTHGELLPARFRPMDKGFGCCFPCLAIFVVCHNGINLCLLNQFDTYPKSYFHEDYCPCHKSEAEHPCVGTSVEVSTFLDIADSFEFLLLVSEQWKNRSMLLHHLS